VSNIVKSSKGGTLTASLTGEKIEPVKFTIKDTEFLLRLFMEAPMLGKDIEQGMNTLGKLKKIHTRLLDKEEEVT
jgi:hypothetical protein